MLLDMLRLRRENRVAVSFNRSRAATTYEALVRQGLVRYFDGEKLKGFGMERYELTDAGVKVAESLRDRIVASHDRFDRKFGAT